ncbi:MAG: hypothetical protein LRZ85_09255 [Alphaproteobacteria bacterium]|nr:hypothetical protein [Alphaproteobacteria bacterium]
MDPLLLWGSIVSAIGLGALGAAGFCLSGGTLIGLIGGSIAGGVGLGGLYIGGAFIVSHRREKQIDRELRREREEAAMRADSNSQPRIEVQPATDPIHKARQHALRGQSLRAATVLAFPSDRCRGPGETKEQYASRMENYDPDYDPRPCES